MSPLPETLYRGDADPEHKRQLYSMWYRGHVLTNLASGGIGKEILAAPLSRSVNRHVTYAWDHTHFLSFTDNYAKAMEFVVGKPPKKVEKLPDDSLDWSALLYWSNTNVFNNVTDHGSGIYTASYPGYNIDHIGQGANPIFREARKVVIEGRIGQPIKVLLINVLTYINIKIAEGVPGLDFARELAEDDREWLLLPIEPWGIDGEFTAELDTGFLHGFHKFRFVE